MKVFSVLLLFLTTLIFPQEKYQAGNINLFSLSNIRKFGDYLYCQHDYLRAIGEYQHYLSKAPNDTIEFKIAEAYSLMGYYEIAAGRFGAINNNSPYYTDARLNALKSIFQLGDFTALRDTFENKWTPKTKGYEVANSLYNFSYLFTNIGLPYEPNFLDAFPKEDRSEVKKFYEWKKDPSYKSPAAAAILSAIIPGMGKFYTHKYADGIWAFIASVGFAYLSYDNFHAKHQFRGWLFGGLAAGFYAGNIYGAAASAQIYNAKIHFNFINDLKAFLDSKNYFLRKFNFCN